MCNMNDEVCVEEMATVRLCAMVSELASTDKWLGYRFYLPEAWRAREENMAHDECGLSACYPSDK